MSDILIENFEVLRQIFRDCLIAKNTNKDLDGTVQKGSLLFVLLKKVNRTIQYELRTAREQLQSQKALVDCNRLHLENLLYEANYLKREIRLCYQLKSQDEDIDIYETDNNQVDESKLTHKQRIERLERELNLRKQLSNEYNNLLNAKTTALNDIVLRTKHLSTFAPSLRVVLEATKPLQENLQLPLEHIWKLEHRANLLPQSLYLAYVNLKLIHMNNDNFMVSVQGAEDEIKNYNNYRKQMDVMKLSNKKFLQPHPLYLQLEINDPEFQNNKLTIDIFHISLLDLLTAHCNVILQDDAIAISENCSISNFLKFICENDFGDCMPYAEIEVKLQKRGISVGECFKYFSENKMGKPYRWLQQMCGGSLTQNTHKTLDSRSYKLKGFSMDIIERIKQYWHICLQLLDPIKVFMANNLDYYTKYNKLKRKPKSSLIDWSPITWDEYASNSITLSYREKELVDERCFFFRAVFACNSAKMNCLISISTKHPLNTPLWVITVNWKGQHNSLNNASIKVMEYWTNCSRDVESTEHMLVSQLIRTMFGFDAFIETQSSPHQSFKWNKEESFIKAIAKLMRPRPSNFFSHEISY